MKKYVVMLTALIISNQLLAQPNPKMTKEEKMQAIDMISALFEKPVPSKVPVPEAISDKGLPKDIPQADFDKKIALFTNSLYFKPSHFNENEVDVEADYFHLPNFDLINGSYKWAKGVAKDGTNIEVSSKNAGSSQSTLDFLQEAIAYKPKAGKTLASIDGTFSMNYSTGFSQITFTKADIGKEKNLEGTIIKLLNIDNDIAMFQLTNRQDGISYYGLNSKGEPLYLEISKSEIPKTFYDAIGSDGKISASKKKEIVEKFEFIPETEPIIGYIKARGSIAQLMVAKAKSFVKKDVPVKALKAPDFEKGEQVGSHERYENMPTAPHFDKITDADLAKSTLKIARMNEMFGFNNHVIIVSVPVSQIRRMPK